MRFLSWNVQHGRRPDGEVDTALLARACATFEADVLALQELDDGLERSDRVHQARVVADACGMHLVFAPAIPGYGNALLSTAPIEQVELVQLPHSPTREPRVGVVARTHDLTVAVTHLGLGGDAVPQLPLLLDALLARPGPHVLLGDLNLEREQVDVGPLDLVDAAPTFPAVAPRRRIDHVAVGGLTVTRVAVLPRSPVSDHRALLVEAAA